MTREELFNSLRKSELLKNTSILISGTIIAQVIPIIIRPFLSRTYLPAVFGVYSVYASIIGVLCVVASLKYELAVVLPKKDKTAANLVILSLLINFGFTFILTLIVIFFGDQICNLLNIPDSYSYFIYLLPAGTFLYSFYQSLSYWLIRKKQFLPLSYNKLFRRGGEGVVQVGFGIGKIPVGLLVGDIIGQLSNVLSGLYQSFKSGFSFKSLSRNKILYSIKKYSAFPKFYMIPSLLSTISFMMPVLMINKFYSSEYTGFFDQSRMLLSIPLALVATSLASVLLQRLSEKSMNNEGLLRDLIPILGILLIIAFLEIIVIEFFGVELFKLIFGKAWGYSGEISRILVWSYAFNFIVSSFSSVFISLNKIKILSIWQFMYFISISSLLLFRSYGFIDFIKLYVLIEIGCYLIYSFILVKVIYQYELSRKKRFV